MSREDWRQQPISPMHGMQPGTRLFYRRVDDGMLRAFVSPPHQPSGMGWHLSISHATNLAAPGGGMIPGRYPSWDEIRDARYDLLPDEYTFGILLPPKAEYVNIHPTTFHLHQVEP